MARAASQTAAVARSVSAIISAHLCLMAWNWPIGRPNCSRILAYADAVSVAQRATPIALRGQQRGHQRTRQGAAQVAQHAVVADLDGVGANMGQRPQRVDAHDGLDLELVGVEHHPLLAAVDGHRKHQHRRLSSRRYGAHLAADDQVIAVPGGGQPGIDGVGGDHFAGGQIVQQFGVGVVRGDQRAGNRGRNERPGHCAVPEFGEDNCQFENAEPLSANGFGQVHALQTLLGGGLPIRRRVGNGSFQRLVQDLGRRHPRHQGSHRIGEVVVLGSDRDRHAATLSINRSVGNDDTVDHIRQLTALL